VASRHPGEVLRQCEVRRLAPQPGRFARGRFGPHRGRGARRSHNGQRMSMQELEGSVAIVTGSARNIGRAIALDLAEGGAAVTVLARSDVAGVKGVAAEIESRGGRALALQADITKPEDAQRIVDETIKAFGRLDILVNNAGIRPEGAFETLTLEAWDEVLAVILDGTFLCCQAALPHLERSGKGVIINIGGLTAYTGATHRVHVITAKAGLDGMTKALAVELAPRKITVNLVAPGLIET